MDSGLPDLVEDDGGPLGITPDGKKKKKGPAMELDSPATPSTSTAAVVKRQPSAKNAAYGIIILSFLMLVYLSYSSKMFNTVSFGQKFRLRRLPRRRHTNLLISVHLNYQRQKLRSHLKSHSLYQNWESRTVGWWCLLERTSLNLNPYWMPQLL